MVSTIPPLLVKQLTVRSQETPSTSQNNYIFFSDFLQIS